MKPLKEKVSITLDPEILEEARHRAELADRTVSAYINLILKNHFKPKQEKGK